MKTSALNFLVCPACKADLELRTDSRSDTEVVEGSLRCVECAATYPVTKGIPRFVSDGVYASSFGWEWNCFSTVQLDSMNGGRESESMLEASTGWKDYRGKLVLDVGVGAGRYAEIVADKGGEVVGIDLSNAVDAAYANIGAREKVHLIQADLFAMPFREQSFDRVYSIGVLHHTPDTRAAFERAAAVVKQGGELAVYLYDRYGFHLACDLIRAVTTRLPLRAMFLLSALAIPAYYIYRLPLLGKLLQLLVPISLHPNWRCRWLDTFDWYTPKYQWKFLYPEVFRWFRSLGFDEIQIFDGPIRMRGRKSARPTEALEVEPARKSAETGRILPAIAPDESGIGLLTPLSKPAGR